MKSKKPDRRRVVTDEPMFLDPALLGTPLASPARRATAYVADLLFILLLVILFIFAVNAARYPALLKTYGEYVVAAPGAAKETAGRKLGAQFYGMLHERNPNLVPAEMKAALESGNDSALAASVSARDLNVVFELDAKESTFDEESGLLRLGSDVVVGFRGFAVGVSVFIAYFTILTWALRGRTPGKALTRIRVTRLDGRKLNLWDSFGRAGGYAASAATGGVGFLEVFWHPNRQTIHDRIVGTVVTRERRGRRG
jgi:uncharacterized RDD family membrane protein YckC